MYLKDLIAELQRIQDSKGWDVWVKDPIVRYNSESNEVSIYPLSIAQALGKLGDEDED